MDFAEIIEGIDSILERIENNFDRRDESLVGDISRQILILQHALPTMPVQTPDNLFELIIQNLSTMRDMITRDHSHMLPSGTMFLWEQPTMEAEHLTNPQRDRGRPRINIDRNTLIALREFGNSWSEIARTLLVSRWTIHRRKMEFNLQDIGSYSTISDLELCELLVSYMEQQSRFVGFSMAYGYLRSIGLKVQQKRIKSCLRLIDPLFNQLRWATLVHRRSYNVRSPNSLWHLDGHHSLVRYGFVIHGCIDGFSRLITFLKCSTNNRSTTVVELFNGAVSNYGLPSRVRTDYGGENVLVWQTMEDQRGLGRGSAIRGTSTQNQRIERLWRDVFRCVCSTYYYTFQAMVDNPNLNL